MLAPTILLGLAALCAFGTQRAAAQQEKATVVPVPINGSQVLEMAKKQAIKDIDNKDQNVAKVEFVQGSEFKKVMILGGGSAGVTRLILTDNDGNKEIFDVLVEFNTEFLRRVLAKVAPTANIQLMQGTGNTLIVSGTVNRAEDIDTIMRAAEGAVGKNAVNAMKVSGVPMVQLDVVIASVSRTEARSMGFSFFTNGNNYFVGNSLGNTGGATGMLTSVLTNTIGNTNTSLTAAPNAVFGLISNQNAFLGFLEALRTENLVKVMAQPKICVLSGKVGNFVSGGEQAVPQIASGSAGGGAVAGVTFVPFGTTVNFLPIVLGDGRIYMDIEPQFTFPDSNPLFSAPIPGTSAGQVAGRDTQYLKTSLILEDGQTYAIGGMIFHNANGSTSKVPVLGDIPFLGFLFSQVNYTDAEQELLILVTPHLIDPMACNQLPKFLPGEETRTPDDFELFLERILEAPRGHREICKDGHYTPAYKNSPNDLYPCPDCNGPHGACDIGRRAGPSCVPLEIPLSANGSCNSCGGKAGCTGTAGSNGNGTGGCNGCTGSGLGTPAAPAAPAAPSMLPPQSTPLMPLLAPPPAPVLQSEVRFDGAAVAEETVPTTPIGSNFGQVNPAVLASPTPLETPQ
jgi:pilus assembly protein CpaC